MSVYAEYLILVFLCFLGVLQLAATANKLNGLSFFKRPTLGYLFAIITIAGALLWFFLSKDRCVQGVEGVEAFVSLAGMAPVAFLVTAAISSRINAKNMPVSSKKMSQDTEGLNALRSMTYFQAIARHFRERKQ